MSATRGLSTLLTVQKATQKQVRLPAPMGGLNGAQSFLDTPITDALGLENFVIRPYGLEIRKGWKYWYDNAFGGNVVTLLPYNGLLVGQSKLFAATSESGAGNNGPLYDVTISAAAVPGAKALVPSTAPDIPGQWSYVQFSTGNSSFLCAVQSGAGYYTYEPAGGWIERPTAAGAGNIQFPGGDPKTTKDFNFITVWKNRLWFIARNSTKAYYLPVGAVAGLLEVFDFGSLFPNGGFLSLILDWTYDSGKGIDDSLVIVSTQGDLIIYDGTNPAVATDFVLRGSWFIGRMPSGQRNYAQQAGDLWIITEYGVMSVSDAVSGRVTAPTQQSSAAGKYNPVLARNVTETLDQSYWFLSSVPSEEVMFLGTPYSNPIFGYRVSWIMSAFTKGWSSVANVDPLCMAVFQGSVYFGDRNGYMKQAFFGYRDGDSYNSATLGSEVTARFITGFYDFGTPTANKTPTRVRLLGVCDGVPAYRIKVKGEYDISETLSTPAPATPSGALWDSAIWDMSFWQFAQQTFKRWFGVSGFGKKLSVQLAIRGSGYTLVTDYEVTYKEGNGL